MAAHSWSSIAAAAAAVFVLQIVLIAAKPQEVALAEPAQSNLNTTTPTEDYIIENKRQYAANILSFDAQLAEFRGVYRQQLNTIEAQQPLIEQKLLEVDQKLNPLELLNDLTKHCVQKYRSHIITVATIRSNLVSCVTSAANVVNNYAAAPENTRNALNNYYNIQLNNALNDCRKRHGGVGLNYTLCVTQVIATTNAVTITNQRQFATQLEATHCSGDSRIKQSVDCSFSAQYTAIASITVNMQLIDNCIAGLEYCPPCADSNSCPNVFDMQLDASDFRNETIRNPFIGFKHSIECLLLNVDT